MSQTSGELLHRLGLYIEETYHREERRYHRAGYGPLQAVLTNRHQQHWKCLCLLLLSTLILVTRGLSNSEIFLTTLPYTAVWALLRLSGLLDTAIENETIFSERHAELGPGLAASYWFGFLQILLRSEDVRENRQTIDVKMREFCQSENLTGTHHDKIFLFISENCNFYDDQETFEKEERIFRFSPKNSELSFKMKGKDKKKMSVHWIFENQSDEQKFIQTAEIDENSRKIFFIFDFPSTLKRALGPGACLVSAEDRKRNLKYFKNTLQCLAGNRGNALEFIDFKLKSRKMPNLHRRPLSDLVRTKIEEQRTRVSLESVSDDEC